MYIRMNHLGLAEEKGREDKIIKNIRNLFKVQKMKQSKRE